MNFCPICEYMLYIETYYEDENKTNPKSMKVRNVCKNCGYTASLENKDKAIMISNTTTAIGNVDVSSFINENIIHDPTIPHVNNIHCPNNDCDSNKEKKGNDVMIVRYDNTNLKYLYHCANCRHTWKN
jgi:DNA-directed RNA polymerase subunit M/transcription elongation factor TFIIS